MKRISVPTLALALFAGAAVAQTAPSPDMAVAAAKNQLGVLEYCQTEGHIDGTAIETQTKIMAMFPAAQDEAAVEASYEKGKTGTVSAMGVEQSLADAAKAQGADEAALCKQIAQAVEQAAAQLPK
ncbi:pore-forming ESAT-6 family protein [Paracoccus sp. N5]|uniref:pore-forming ESAT-6 family protein n=1 Tax=Paracoccus sp. N5 TaxID=1101189 RepID=UPI00035FE97B|nr:pore-forming ESAT-6 family protein [Paracoccus sp. N5]